jgi:NhaP-type Na+/H+ or K+/H+ antiporter
MCNFVSSKGIIALFTAAVVQSYFVDRNQREGSRLGTRSFLFLLGQLSETIVFVIVGALTMMYCLHR